MKPLTPAQRRVLLTLHEQTVSDWIGPAMFWPHDWQIVRKLERRGHVGRLHVVRGRGSSILTGLTPKGYAALGMADPLQRGEFIHYPTHKVQIVSPQEAAP